MGKTIRYSKVGDDYSTKDPIKILAQKSAKETSKNLALYNFSEIAQTRGESAYVWKQGNVYMASVIEGLGTKNMIADEMRKITGKTYYDVIAHDTVATIINDLITVGAAPLVIHAYWAIENNEWLTDKKRMEDLITGWKKASDLAGASWGGGETPTLKGIMRKNQVELGGSSVGIISTKKRLVTGDKLRVGDQIILLKSNGINANGASLVRALAHKLPKGFGTKLPSGKLFGESVLSKSNIYAKLIQRLLDENIDIHYLSNITGHGHRKIMRAKQEFSYIIESIIEPPELFLFLQKEAGMSDEDAYGTFNMGMDFAVFIPDKDIKQTLKIIEKCGFAAIHAGYIKKGKRCVEIVPKNIKFMGETLELR